MKHPICPPSPLPLSLLLGTLTTQSIVICCVLTTDTETNSLSNRGVTEAYLSATDARTTTALPAMCGKNKGCKNAVESPWQVVYSGNLEDATRLCVRGGVKWGNIYLIQSFRARPVLLNGLAAILSLMTNQVFANAQQFWGIPTEGSKTQKEEKGGERGPTARTTVLQLKHWIYSKMHPKWI